MGPGGGEREEDGEEGRSENWEREEVDWNAPGSGMAGSAQRSLDKSLSGGLETLKLASVRSWR